MFKNKKVMWAGLSTLFIAIVLISSMVVSQKHIESATKAASIHKAKDQVIKNKSTKQVNPEKEDSVKEDKTTPVKTEDATRTKTTEPKPEAPTIKSIDPVTKYVDVSSLNVRSGPGTNYSSISVITRGDAVTVSAISGDWNKVSFDKESGWVSSHYLSNTKPVVVKETPDTTKTTKDTTKKSTVYTNDADRLKTVDRNKQLILVTASSYSSRTATIQTFEKGSNGKWKRIMKVSGHVGKRGMGKASEGDTKTPVGKYSLGTAFGQKGNPGTKMPWREITSDDVWVDDPDSSLYNTWQSKSKTAGLWDSAENMAIPPYVYGFVINYNTARVPGAGSAIFFHVGSGYTLGCVDTTESNVISILKWLDPAKNPAIIITPTQDLYKY